MGDVEGYGAAGHGAAARSYALPAASTYGKHYTYVGTLLINDALPFTPRTLMEVIANEKLMMQLQN